MAGNCGCERRRAPRVPASVGIPSVLDEDVCARTGALRPGAHCARRRTLAAVDEAED
jgi:hypothetical protein